MGEAKIGIGTPTLVAGGIAVGLVLYLAWRAKQNAADLLAKVQGKVEEKTFTGTPPGATDIAQLFGKIMDPPNGGEADVSFFGSTFPVTWWAAYNGGHDVIGDVRIRVKQIGMLGGIVERTTVVANVKLPGTGSKITQTTNVEAGDTFGSYTAIFVSLYFNGHRLAPDIQLKGFT